VWPRTYHHDNIRLHVSLSPEPTRRAFMPSVTPTQLALEAQTVPRSIVLVVGGAARIDVVRRAPPEGPRRRRARALASSWYERESVKCSRYELYRICIGTVGDGGVARGRFDDESVWYSPVSLDSRPERHEAESSGASTFLYRGLSAEAPTPKLGRAFSSRASGRTPPPGRVTSCVTA
jgi:hypothetical protein